MATQLPISRLINTTVNLAPVAAQAQSTSNMLVVGTSDVIDVVERMRTYSTLAEVAADFGTSAEEYKAANFWFQQAPQPTTVSIGKWAVNDTAGLIRCSPLTTTLADFQDIANGGFKVTIDGTLRTLTALDFTEVTSLNGVAGVVNAALQAAVGTGAQPAEMTYDAVYNRFTLTSATTGVGSTVSYFTSPDSGVDVSGLLGGTSSFDGVYIADGIAAEEPVTAVTIMDDMFGQQWYGLMVPSAGDDQQIAIADYVEAATTNHFFGISSDDVNTITAGNTTTIAYRVTAAGYNKTTVQYSRANTVNSLYVAASLMGRILTTNYNGNNTTITLMYKQEPGVIPETLTTTQINALESVNANVFVAYNNDTAIIERGTVGSGEYIDTIVGLDWLSLQIQTEVYNALYTSTTKIPQTDAGNAVLATIIESVCAQGVANGLLAPGIWNSAGFGSLKQGDFLAKGFYVYAPPVALQSSQDRAARKSVAFQVAVKLAGAIHTSDITINVNR